MAKVGFLRDEQGNLSSGRLAFWIAFTWTVVFVSLHICGIIVIPDLAYKIMTVIFTVLGSWTAGPRLAQYIMPNVGSIFNSNKSSNYSHQNWGEEQ